MPRMPFSLLQDDFAPFRDVVGHQGGLANAQVHIGTVVDVCATRRASSSLLRFDSCSRLFLLR